MKADLCARGSGAAAAKTKFCKLSVSPLKVTLPFQKILLAEQLAPARHAAVQRSRRPRRRRRLDPALAEAVPARSFVELRTLSGIRRRRGMMDLHSRDGPARNGPGQGNVSIRIAFPRAQKRSCRARRGPRAAPF